MRGIVLLLMLSWLSVPGPSGDQQQTGQTLEILTTDPLVVSVPGCDSINMLLFNAKGQLVLHWAGEQISEGLLRPRISMDTLPDGIYFLRFDCQEQTCYEKLVIRHH